MQTRIRIGKQTIVSTSPYSTVITDATNEQEYVPQGLAGEVLTSNGVGVAPSYQPASSGSGFLSYVLAAPTASLVIGFNVNTNVVNYTEITDVLNEFDPVTGIFTAAATGRYFVEGHILWTPVANLTGDHQTQLNFGGLEWRQNGSGAVTSSVNGKYSTYSTIVSLTAGQTIRMSGRVDFGTGVGGTIFGNGDPSTTRFIVKRIE